MMRVPIHLDENQAAFVREHVAAGRFANPSDAIRAALVLLEDQLSATTSREAALRDMLLEAKAGGISTRHPEEAWAGVEAKAKQDDA